ncbi:MAG: twin-arginine translocation signal domain-containing protein [Gemmatimonadetes bacterium]|nr:twin-arginine translocation signal domain-containing protein [Gemmatimonadota bacterium]
MPFSRRDFLSTLGVGAVAAANGVPLHAAATPPDHLLPIATDWDVSWTDRVKGRRGPSSIRRTSMTEQGCSARSSGARTTRRSTARRSRSCPRCW